MVRTFVLFHFGAAVAADVPSSIKTREEHPLAARISQASKFQVSILSTWHYELEL